MNIKKASDWNKVTTKIVLKEGGSAINNYYNGSLKQGNVPKLQLNLVD
jgi:hypothetical protein